METFNFRQCTIIVVVVAEAGPACCLRGRQGILRERCLRCPVPCRYRRDDAVSERLLECLELKYIIRKTKSVGVQIEVTVGRGVIAWLAVSPSYVVVRRSYHTILRWAAVVSCWWLRPKVTTIRLWGVANISGFAAKCEIASWVESYCRHQRRGP